MYKKSAFVQSVVDTLDVLENDFQPLEADFTTPSFALLAPVVNCPLAIEDVEMAQIVSSPLQPMITLLQVVSKQEPADVCIPHMKSNKDNPIVIDSDEEDHILSAVRKRLPYDDESDILEGLAEKPTEKWSEPKVTVQKSLQIQLRRISKSKLSINRAILLKNRELKIQNMKLLQQLAEVRKLREQDDERWRSCGLGSILGGTIGYPSASTSKSFQAITSIASVPEISQSKAELPQNLPRHAAKDFIVGTQESALHQSQGATVIEALANLKPKTKKKRRYHSKNKLNGYVSDEESSSPKLCNFRHHQPKYKICISKQITEDIDEVTSLLKE